MGGADPEPDEDVEDAFIWFLFNADKIKLIFKDENEYDRIQPLMHWCS